MTLNSAAPQHHSLRCNALIACLGLASMAAHAQGTDPAAEVQRILASPAYKTAVATIDKEHGRIVEDGIKLTEIPAPPFGEKVRAQEFEKMMKAVGLSDVQIDAEGNVLGLRKGTRSDGKVAWYRRTWTPSSRPAPT